jgi:hypothetical protein
MSIFVIGYPSEYGGADTELWHTLRLWRRFGLAVTAVPTWRPDPEQQRRLLSIGVPTVTANGPSDLASIPGLAGSTVIAFCNGEFLKHAELFRELGCRIVWANCMTWVFPHERAYHEKYGPFDAYIFQSGFQRESLASFYKEYGASEQRFFSIHGALDFNDYHFAPCSHQPGQTFVIGRIARDDLDKWSSNLWPIYSAVPYHHKRARVMAWSPRLTEKCGAPPEWAEPLPARAEPAQQFFSQLHCMLAINGGAKENWPRAGLEAMACGVPVVAQRQWGWCEMVIHGITGFLGRDDHELAFFTAALAYDETLRIEMALNARRRLESVLANPEVLWTQWQSLFESLGPVETD